MIKCAATLLLSLFVTSLASAQERDVVVTGGWLFASTSNARVRNPGILIRAGKILRVGGDLSIAAPNAERVQVADAETVVPGFFDLHAHYAMDLFSAGRKDETVAYPLLFIANGVTSTFPAGEMDPDSMRALRIKIDNGEVVGPRLMNSGPYFGTARPNWNREITSEQIYAEIDHWAEMGIKGIKTKGITPDELKAVIERAHFHGLTVTGHLDSGNRNSVNPRDAVIMGIDRIEHFMGGDAFVADKSAYASYQDMTFDTPAFKKIAALFIAHHAYFDATLSTYGMYGAKDTTLTNYFAGDERRFLTPYMRDIITKRPTRPNNVQFEKIYYTKRKEIKAFFDAGGGDLMTLGTDHPSWGVWFTPFSAAREMYAYSASGIPNWQILKIATINSARAMGFGGRLGTIEAGKWADLVVLRGNPLQDIKHVRNPRVVIKAGRVYDPAALLKSAEGKIGPASAADTAAWAPTPRTGRRGCREAGSGKREAGSGKREAGSGTGVRFDETNMRPVISFGIVAGSALAFLTAPLLLAAQQPVAGLTSADVYKLRSLGDVQISPDGKRVAYAVTRRDGPGRPSSEAWIRDLSSSQETRLGTDATRASGPRWSPDGQSVAFFGRVGDSSGVAVAHADGGSIRFIAPVSGTNHVLPSMGERMAWSPDGKRLAFVSSTPGPEEDANGDPMVITRYSYKPTASEGLTRFDDNRRLHIFVADLSTRQVKQLTSGNYYEHSIQWSPDGKEIAFISNHGADPDRVFNYDVFALNVASGAIRQITNTRNAEYQPVWSPDGRTIAYLGTKRELTSSETTMEDTHVWTMNADGSNRRELGQAIDNRQRAPRWAPDGKAIYTIVQVRGSSHLYRVPVDGRKPAVIIGDEGSVESWALTPSGGVMYGFSSPTEPAMLRERAANGTTRDIMKLNAALLSQRRISPVEPLTFKAKDGMAVEAYLTMPLNRAPNQKYPMVVAIHGGPHGAQGPAFNDKAQVYATHGFATLMVNYRGSTGYGQAFADAIFGDQNGKEAEDVLSGVDAVIAKYPWVDSARLGVEGGSYGGQLANWLITRTPRFKAAVPAAGIANLVSFNYMAYYHDYLAVEFGRYPHEKDLMDTLWARSALRYVNRVKTPVMFIHGENDNDVPIAEAEQYYVALKDVGVPTIMVRYPREGHGVRETKHVVDVIDRSVGWYDRWFSNPDGKADIKVVP